MPYIGIDTNIFEHLLNRAVNHDSHIDKLLIYLSQQQYQLLVDSTKKIGKEYEQKIVPIIKNMDEDRVQLPLLRFWMNPDIRHSVELNPQDNLMQHIIQVIHERDELTDRVFVYVVCRENATLVTNDRTHILDRHDDLLRKTRRERGTNTDIQSSDEAHDIFCGNGENQRD